MAHELDFSKGQAAIAFRGAVPWHQLGNAIEPGDSLDTIMCKGGLEYDVERAPARFDRKSFDAAGQPITTLSTDPNTFILYRSDTGAPLSNCSPKYQVVQPREVINFYQDLTEKFGFEIEVVGALKGGRKVWALANTKNAFQLRGNDDVKGFLLFATSYDGTMSTQVRHTSVRVVCNNTIQIAVQGKPEVSIPHSTKFDADAVKRELKIGEAWEKFHAQAEQLQDRIVTRDETIKLFMDAYYGLTSTDDIKAFQENPSNEKTAEKFMARMTEALFNSPGAHLASARGTLWGVLNAVTNDVDFSLPSRSNDTRFDKGQFGVGNQIKQRALTRALAMVA